MYAGANMGHPFIVVGKRTQSANEVSHTDSFGLGYVWGLRATISKENLSWFFNLSAPPATEINLML